MRPACPRPPPQTRQEPRPSPVDVRRSRPPDPLSTAPLPASASSAALALPHVPSLQLGQRELPVPDAAGASELARSEVLITTSPVWGPEMRRPLSETSRHSRDAPGLDGTTIPGSLRGEVLPAGSPGISGHGIAGVGRRVWHGGHPVDPRAVSDCTLPHVIAGGSRPGGFPPDRIQAVSSAAPC